jgi:hypothetical protein
MDNIKKNTDFYNSEDLGDSLNELSLTKKPTNKIIENVILEENTIDADLLLKYKKANEEAREKSEWGNIDEMVIENMVQQFTAFSDDNGLEWEKFDYSGDYNEKYYKDKFPLFDDDTIDILVKCSKTKAEDNRIPTMKKVEGNFLVEFD